jgi:hypothetical protein
MGQKAIDQIQADWISMATHRAIIPVDSAKID